MTIEEILKVMKESHTITNRASNFVEKYIKKLEADNKYSWKQIEMQRDCIEELIVYLLKKR